MLAALFLLPGLSACGGLERSSSGVLPQGVSAQLAPDATARAAQSNSARLAAAAPFATGPGYRLYVANGGSNSITVYHASASGNTAPIATIAGSNTQLNSPVQLSEDADGNLYVANQGASSILVFAHGANGNVSPIRVIAGPLTGLSANYLDALTVDQTTGKIFAVTALGDTVNQFELLRFAPNASGDEAPLATVGVSNPAIEIASDSTDEHIIEAAGPDWPNGWTSGVDTFKKFPNGSANPRLYAIYNFAVDGIADDPTTKTFLVSGYDGVTEGIFRLDEDTVGGGGSPPSLTPAVVSIITSDTCGSQLALGSDRNIYVAHSTTYRPCSADAVYVYEHDASGNATPLRVLTGSATNLDGPSGIYEGK
jgi:hypothetical protein